jgi:uncharacterized delta-60 repeat protein
LAGGSFTIIGGQTRNFVARLDGTTGLADSFNPSAGGIINSIAVQADGKILPGGSFISFAPNGGATVTRNNIARLEADGSLDQTVDLSIVGNVVYAIAVQPDGKILIGGSFTTVLGVARNNIARLNTDGTLDTVFNPNSNGEVYSIAVQADGKILAGGIFSSIGGQSRFCIAALDGTTGSVLDWDPGSDGVVWSLSAYENTVYAGGGFARMGAVPAAGLAAINAADPPVAAVPGARQEQSFVLAQNFPNPARLSTSIRFTLAEAVPVSLEVFDLQGRRVAAPLESEPQEVGTHEIQVRTASWPAGCYLYRIEAGRTVMRRKMLVVR